MTLHLYPLYGLPVVCMIADRFAGGPYMKRMFGDPPPLHPRIVAAIFLALYGMLAFLSPWGACIGVAFLIWRGLGWAHFGTDMNPPTWGKAALLGLIHLMWVLLLMACAFILHGSLDRAMGAGVGFAICGGVFGHVLYDLEQDGITKTQDVNAYVECARGFVLGLAMLLVFS